MSKICLVQTVNKTKDRYYVQDVNGGSVVPKELPRRLKLMKENIESLPFEASGQRLHYDSELAGFYLIIGRTKKTYYVQTWVQKTGNDVRRKVGVHGQLAPDQARKKARRMLMAMQDGVEFDEEDQPVKSQNGSSTAEPAQDDGRQLSLQAAFNEYLRTRQLKENTRHDYEQLVKRSFSDWLGQPIIGINKRMVLDLHAANKDRFGHPYADYGMRVLSAIINHDYYN